MKSFLCLLLLSFTLISSSDASMTCNGTMRFGKGSTAWGNFTIGAAGSFEGEEATLYSLTNKGTMDLIKCQVLGEVISYGKLNALETEFLVDMTLCSGEVVLDSCKIPNIFIYNIDDSSLEIHLKGDCLIDGHIVFDEGTGKVFKSPETIITGEIINGNLIEEE